MTSPRKIAYSTAGALIILFAVATNARSLAWQSNELLVEQSLESYPDSRFMRMELANLKMNSENPDASKARDNYDYLTKLDRPTTRFIGHIGIITVVCFDQGSAPKHHLEAAMQIRPESFEPDLESAIGNLINIVSAKECEGLGAEKLGDELSAWLTRTDFSPTLAPVWRTRYQIARLYSQAHLEKKALNEAKAAWSTGEADLPIGMMIVGLSIRLGHIEDARRMLEGIRDDLPKGDKVAWDLYNEYRGAVE